MPLSAVLPARHEVRHGSGSAPTGSRPTIVLECLSATSGGGQTYLANLFKSVPEEFLNRHRIIALISLGAEALRTNDRIEYIAPPSASKGLLSRWAWTTLKLPALLRDLQADVLYCPGGPLSTRNGPWRTAVAFQNTLPFSLADRKRYPPGYERTRLFLLNRILSRSFRTADLVIFLSEHGRSVIQDEHRIPTRHSVVIPHGIHEAFRHQADSADLPPSLGRQPYVAYVSIFDVYKAQLEVVRAWRLLRERRRTPEKLVLVGKHVNQEYATSVLAEIERSGLQEEVIVCGGLPHHQLPSIYQHAAINVFASTCENCPNILLEALSAARPVISSRHAPMPEFAGDAALYFSPESPEELAAQLARVLDDQTLGNRLGQHAAKLATRYTWESTARATWSALGELAANR